MGVYRGNIFALDWTDLEQVKIAAEKLAAGRAPKQIVVKHPSRDNYNISFAERKKQHIREGYAIIYTTSNGV